MNKMKVFKGNMRMKDIYVGATRWEIFKWKTARFLRKVLIVSFVAGLVWGAFQLGTLSTATEYVHAQEKVIEVPSKAPVLDRIAKCESTATHTRNGQVLLHANTDGTVDVGLYQINMSAWGKKATELGLDLTKETDNHKMAEWIFQNIGTGPWSASKACWNK